MLALPAGYLVVIGAAGVTAVLDDKGKEVWAGVRQVNERTPWAFTKVADNSAKG